MKKWADLNTEPKAYKNKGAGKSVNPICDDHFHSSHTPGGRNGLPRLKIWAEQHPHLLNELQDALVCYSVKNKVGVLTVINDPLTP